MLNRGGSRIICKLRERKHALKLNKSSIGTRQQCIRSLSVQVNTIPRIDELHSEMTEWRHDFHMNPELAFEEVRTSNIIAEKLESWGIQVSRNLAKTGVVGTLQGNKTLPVGSSVQSIGLRADMDALPMEELNDFHYRSRVPGKMHGCGHDGHTTMLLGAAQYLAETRNFGGTVHFIFQPAEEDGGGGGVMVEEGLFKKFPCDQIYGMHNWPLLPVGQISVRAGPIMGSSDEFDIKITGKGGHAAIPNQTIDPIFVASQVIVALQGAVSRVSDPVKPSVLSVTKVNAGSAYNVIPETATLAGTVRTLDEDTRSTMNKMLHNVTRSVVEGFGATCTIDLKEGYPVTSNAKEPTKFASEVATSVFGRENVFADVEPTMGAEDFSYMLKERPGCYVWIGQGITDEDHMVHHPLYDFNDAILPIGASYFVKLVEEGLK